jgi:hypothetical protein
MERAADESRSSIVSLHMCFVWTTPQTQPRLSYEAFTLPLVLAGNRLTFNTTTLPLEGNPGGVIKLFARKPLKSITDPVRRLYVTQEISDLLDGKTNFGHFPNVAAERLIGIFCAGQLLCISRKKNKALTDLERLEGHDEVWCLCPRKPKPGWRLLGRFLEKDRLVLFRAWDKQKLARNYDRAAKEVIEDWEKQFGSASPCGGKELSDYVSGVVRDVDVKEN